MTDIPTMIENFAKSLRKQLQPIDNLLNNRIEAEKPEALEAEIVEQVNHIPQSNVAIFWDYENFPIPNGFSDELFFEALFSSGNEERYILKRVYSKPEIIKSKISVLEKHGFEFKEGLLSGKTNEIDHVLMVDCVEYCTESDEPLLVVLMAGDADYMALVEKLAEKGHEVRIICNDKQKVSPSLQKIIPVIYDRKMLTNEIQNLNNQLYNLSCLTNYILSLEDNNTKNFNELFEEIIKYYTDNLNKRIMGLFNVMLNHQDYKWQYTVSNEFIQKLEVVSNENASNQLELAQRFTKQELLAKLGYEEDYELWTKAWDEFKEQLLKREDQLEFLMNLYKTVNLPYIRNYIQRELIRILLEEQTKNPTSTKSIFRNTKDINDYLDKLHERDKVIKSKHYCNQCTKSFNSNQSLQQHKRAVHKKKRPANLCPICGKKLQDTLGMENHKRQKHNPNDQPLPYECPQCYLRFEKERSLKDHKREKHNIS